MTPTPSKPAVMITRSTTSQSIASEVAQVMQTKVAFKQVSSTHSLSLNYAMQNLTNAESGYID